MSAFGPGSRLGAYDILTLLGSGGMGAVYRARDTKLGREVALKVLPDDVSADPERRTRFEREARVLATLNHPNVAAIYGLDDSTDRIALVMELVEGVPLTELIRSNGLRLNEALKLAAQVAAGLEAAHRVGVVHRDLKPANVLVTPSGSVKLVDFGIAKRLEPAGVPIADAQTVAARPNTGAWQILGTVAYMSPEQARGEAIDARSDLFSFGTLLYEMLTGHRPFDAENDVATLAAILHREPTPPSVLHAGLPREVERIVLRCLRKDRERRFQTASDLKLSLEDLQNETATTEAKPATVSTRRSIASAALIIGVCLAAIGAAAYYFSGTDDHGARPALRQLTFEAGVAITPALSPDGRLLAYASDRSAEGQLDIWLKQIAGGEPARLTSGPDSKVNPQFSPDGTRIYFLGGRNELSEVSTLGGTSRRILEAAGPFSVSSRGDIAFHRVGTGTAPGPIFILPAGSASIEPWHPECVSSGAPVWSPDGSRIGFAGLCGPLSDGSQQRDSEILVGPRTGDTMTRIGTVQTRTPAPRLAWVRLSNGADALLIPQRSGDSVNLHRLMLDGAVRAVTSGTGLENWPAVSPSGDLLFTRTEQTPSIWSLALAGGGGLPTKEVSPGRMFGTSLDGSKLVFGRMLGAEQGQLVLRDRGRGTETVLASHSVVREGSGSFWPQVAPDGARVIYRVNVDASASRQYLISSDGGAPRLLAASKAFSLASDWSADGKRVIGECFPVAKGACELFPDTDSAKLLFNDPRGGEVLAPSFSWDGRWVAFMLRRAGRTMIYAASVDEAGSVAGEDRWVRISPEDGDAGRPRFSPDGSSVFYHQIRGSVVRLVRQRIDASTRQPLGDPQPLAAILNIPQSVFNIALQYVVTVTKDRVFFNTAEIRSNVWMTKVE